MEFKLFGRFLKGKNGGKSVGLSYEDLKILRVAERFHKLPEEIENMDSYWYSRALILMTGEYERDQIK